MAKLTDINIVVIQDSEKIQFKTPVNVTYAGYIFPELKKSENELIRKRLINLIKELAANKKAIHTGGYFVEGQDKKYIAYLEKQKEQKYDNEYLEDVRQYAYNKGIVDAEEKYKEQQPAEWSEEDEAKKENLISIVKRALHGNEYRLLNDNGATELITWLKSLRPQPHWKPTFEQMQALNEAKNEFEGSSDWDSLDSLYDDLQKLL